MWPARTTLFGFLALLAFALADSSYRWEWGFDGTVPCDDAIYAGFDAAFDPTQDVFWQSAFLGRVHHNNYLVPSAVFVFSKQDAIYNLNGTVYTTPTYEVLCGGGVSWQQVDMSGEGAAIPDTALPIGHTGKADQILYGCKTLGETLRPYSMPGFVDPATLKCNVTVRTAIKPNPLNYIIQEPRYYLLVENPPSCGN